MKSISLAISIVVSLTCVGILMGAAASDPTVHAIRAGTFCPDGETCTHSGSTSSNPFKTRFGSSRRGVAVAGFGDAYLATGSRYTQ